MVWQWKNGSLDKYAGFYLVKRQRARLWSGRSEIQIWGRSNRTQCCQRLATVATFLQMKLCCPDTMTRKWAPPTRYTLRRNAASMMKDLIRVKIKKSECNAPIKRHYLRSVLLKKWELQYLIWQRGSPNLFCYSFSGLYPQKQTSSFWLRTIFHWYLAT